MKELNELTAQKMQQLCTDGTLEGMIEDSLKKMLKDQVDSAIRSYSDFGKAIGEKIEASIGASLTQVSLPEYNNFIAHTVVSAFESNLKEQAQKQIVEVIEDKLTPVPKEMAFEALTDKIKSYWGDECLNHGHDTIGIEWDGDDENERIELKIIHPEYDWYNIKATFYRHKGMSSTKGWYIGYLYNGQNGRISDTITASTQCHDLLAWLFKMYAARTEIMDLDNCIGETVYIGHNY